MADVLLVLVVAILAAGLLQAQYERDYWRDAVLYPKRQRRPFSELGYRFWRRA